MQLTIRQRFLVAFLYGILILSIGYCLSQSWNFLYDSNEKLNSILLVTALSLILGTYITEPFFSKPVDALTRWVAIYLFLLGINENSPLLYQNPWIIAAIVFQFFSLLLILTYGIRKIEKIQKIATEIVCKISRPEIIFSLLYFDIVLSYYRENQQAFPILIGFGFLMAINQPINAFIGWVWKIAGLVNKSNIETIGQIVGFESPNLYKIEILNATNPSISKGTIVYFKNGDKANLGVAINKKNLAEKHWIEVMALKTTNDEHVILDTIDSKISLQEAELFPDSHDVFVLDLHNIGHTERDFIKSLPLKTQSANLVGYVWMGSTISQIRFHKTISDTQFKAKNLGEGSIIYTYIAGEKVLYQIIDATTNEEHLDNKDTYGFTIGIAQKLGKYITESNELQSVKWLPSIYSPVYLLEENDAPYNPENFIGTLPGTNLGIPIKNIQELVTHNTAILGILGIGKSFLTFELLQKLIAQTDVKIFCIDLTNQYKEKLGLYIDPAIIIDNLSDDTLKALKATNKDGTDSRNPLGWGNEQRYKDELTAAIASFTQDPQARILILNPDLHSVGKAGSQFTITHRIDLTAAEKTRCISEQIFIKARSQGETTSAKYLIVYEEAHSLIPEWNSAANDGDRTAANGTAKVILQGRKYGLGSFVITQRTANISKSILNQCNTIFALRVFDDTGKQFLENYIGSSYSNLLSTLEERHCIAIGKALKLKQPIVLRLNDFNEINKT